MGPIHGYPPSPPLQLRSGRRLRSALLALAAYRNQPRGLGLYLLHVMPSSAYPFFRVYAAL